MKNKEKGQMQKSRNSERQGRKAKYYVEILSGERRAFSGGQISGDL